MRQRSSKTGTPLNQKQQELAQRENKLREEMQKLERMIAEAPRIAEEANRRNREELVSRASEGRGRLDVSMALQDKRYSDGGGSPTARLVAEGAPRGPIRFSGPGDRIGRGRPLAPEPFAF